MTKEEALSYWINKKDIHINRDAVGVEKYWEKIQPGFDWERLTGQSAWDRIESFYPPNWNNWKRMKLKDWVSKKHPNYHEFINQEKEVGKLDKIIKNEIKDCEYIVFEDAKTGQGMLVDGNHRYIDNKLFD